MKYLPLLICMVVSAFLCSAQAAEKAFYNTTTDGKKIAWMSKGMKAVKTKLKDPGSAEFKGVYFFRGADDVPMTCGAVNSKNSFGGYGGYQRFVSAGRTNLTFLEKEVEGFEGVWQKFCE